MRIWVVFKAVGSGHYSLLSHAIYYTQHGTRYRQILPQGFLGPVSRNGMHVSPAWFEKRCLAYTALLNS